MRFIYIEFFINRKYIILVGLRMMEFINYYNKNEDFVKKVVGGIIEELIKRFEERKTVMENVLIGIDGFFLMKLCIENSVVDGINVFLLV